MADSSLLLVASARERLEWLLGEYGEDDVDFVIFEPVVDELEKRLLARDEREQP